MTALRPIRFSLFLGLLIAMPGAAAQDESAAAAPTEGIPAHVSQALDAMTTALEEHGPDATIDALRGATIGWEETERVTEAAALWSSLGRRFIQMRRLESALVAHREAARLCRVAYGDEPHPKTAEASSALGYLYAQLMERPVEGLVHFENALATFRTLAGETDSAQIASVLNNIGFCHSKLGLPERALPLYEEAWEMRRRMLGDVDHYELANSLVNIAECLFAMGQAPGALLRHQEALAMFRRMHEGDHPNVALGLNNVGGCLRAIGRVEEAREMLRESVAMWRRIHPQGHPFYANALDNLGGSVEDPDEADALFGEALAMRRRLYGDGHPILAKSMTLISYRWLADGRTDEGLAMLEEVLTSMRTQRPADHPDVLAALINLGEALMEAGRTEDGERIFEEAAQMLERQEAAKEGHASEAPDDEETTEPRRKKRPSKKRTTKLRDLPRTPCSVGSSPTTPSLKVSRRAILDR